MTLEQCHVISYTEEDGNTLGYYKKIEGVNSLDYYEYITKPFDFTSWTEIKEYLKRKNLCEENVDFVVIPKESLDIFKDRFFKKSV